MPLERLMGYPMVRERVDDYVIEEGSVYLLDVTSGRFVAISD